MVKLMVYFKYITFKLACLKNANEFLLKAPK